jgi:hypothetical protein
LTAIGVDGHGNLLVVTLEEALRMKKQPKTLDARAGRREGTT